MIVCFSLSHAKCEGHFRRYRVMSIVRSYLALDIKREYESKRMREDAQKATKDARRVKWKFKSQVYARESRASPPFSPVSQEPVREISKFYQAFYRVPLRRREVNTENAGLSRRRSRQRISTAAKAKYVLRIPPPRCSFFLPLFSRVFRTFSLVLTSIDQSLLIAS